MKQIRLSPSKLNEFNDCPRCFYDAYTLGIKKPRGIFPSLPGGLDRVLKVYFDRYRGTLPPELTDKVPGVLMADMAKINKWRNWRTGLGCTFDKEAVSIGGALDDCLVDGEIYIPIDNKSKGNIPKDDGSQYYQTQLDCYNLMLRENGHKIGDDAYLVYWYPAEVGPQWANKLLTSIGFGVAVYKLASNAERGKEVLVKAAECLRSEKPPLPSSTCEHCSHIARHQEYACKTEV